MTSFCFLQYKTERDGVVETRVEQKITIQSDGDPIDHDKALAEAIQEVILRYDSEFTKQSLMKLFSKTLGNCNEPRYDCREDRNTAASTALS